MTREDHDGAGSAGAGLRVAGCDLGKACAKFAVGRLDGAGRLVLEAREGVEHAGRPMEAFAAWYARADIATCAALGATGLGAEELVAPVMTGLPEEACLEAALALLGRATGPVNLVTVGARGYAVLARGEDGRCHHLENDKCSSGTGETMVKLAGRFGLDIAEADSLAFGAAASIPITARCSVFAKSEMTHFGNQGKPAAELFRGYFDAVAHYAAALLARVRVPGPVWLVGGGSRLAALRAGLERALGQAVEVPRDALAIEAIGAMALAAEQARSGLSARMPGDPRSLMEARPRRFRALEPASDFAARVRQLEAPPVALGAERAPAVLGIDLGSTGSKAVLASLDGGAAVLSVYDRTRGNPVDAAQRLVRALLDKTEPDVRAIGLTGSGREAAATVLRAVYPEMAPRIVVMNEIVAHATAAIRCDEEGGESLSVVEIGGQDAKFIQIAGGQIVESDMNKACSAGTGSFLEEQALLYGIDDIGHFTELAAEARRPPELGQMCTVFVAEAAAEAHGQGFELRDLFGGFQYSVVHNYMNRVMGQRRFGRRIFFQGKPASGRSLAWTLAAVSGREVVVPPDPGAMGAWGIGLCALEELGADALAAATPFELGAVLSASVVKRSELRCRDKDCETLCTIEKTLVAVGEDRHTVLSGGACPKYEISSAKSRKLPKEAPNAFEERERAVERYLAVSTREEHDDGSAFDDRAASGRRSVAVPVVGACAGFAPWLVTLVRALGRPVEVLRSDAGSLGRGEARCYSFDACAPAKIAHGVLDTDAELVFFPKLLGLSDRDGDGGASCPMEQALPEMVREALRARGRALSVIHPVLSLEDGLETAALEEQLRTAARRLGVDPARVPAAMRAAAAAQRRYERELAAIGARTLEHARREGLPVVVVCGALHVIHDRALSAGIPQLLREAGVLALPMDCFAIPPETPPMPRVGWLDARRALRTAVAARRRGDLYPLLLTAFGCGPSSFAEQIFAALLEGHPHTALESDGHGGAAGYATRVQAFVHAVRRHDGRPSAASAERLRLLEPLDKPPLEAERASRLVLFGCGDRLGPIIAAAYRSFGYDARAPEAADAAALALGRRDCSGKECLPYQLIWGSFRKEVEREPLNGDRTVLVQVSGDGKCRNCMFSVKDQLSLERMGLDDQVVLRHFGNDESVDLAVVFKVWTGTTLWDVLLQLASYYRPLERTPGAVDALYESLCDEVVRFTELPLGTGLDATVRMARGNRWALALAERASRAFASVARPEPADSELRTAFLSGDVYVRVDTFANDDLVRRLNRRGLKVLVEPSWVLSDYMAEERLTELLGLPTGLWRNAITKAAMKLIRRQIYARVSKLHPWLHTVEARQLLEAGRPLLDRHPQGEAPITLGSVLHTWRSGACDGVVVANPWGCAPALVSESLLRHQREIPMLFVYADGSPIDERRLDAFAFRLRRGPPIARRRAAATAPN